VIFRIYTLRDRFMLWMDDYMQAVRRLRWTFVVLLVLLLFHFMFECGQAHAQAASAPANVLTCTGQPTSLPVNVPGGDFECIPLPTSTSTLPTIRSSATGKAAWWYCKRPSGVWALQLVAAAPGSAASMPPVDEFWSAVASSAPTAGINALRARYPGVPLGTPAVAAAWCPYWAEMQAGRPAPDPVPPAPAPTPAWRTASTRAYTVVNGNLGGLAGTAPSGVPCLSPIKIFGQTYGTWAGAPTPQTMTVCKQQQ